MKYLRVFTNPSVLRPVRLAAPSAAPSWSDAAGLTSGGDGRGV